MTGKMSEQELIERDAARNLGAELLQSVKEMKAGKAARMYSPEVLRAVNVRKDAGLSQSQFAALLDVPLRTLQEWEQGRLPTQ